jgi:serine/threonine protein kinase
MQAGDLFNYISK